MTNKLIDQDLIEKIDAVLPQTQCRQCGFSGCKPYASAIVTGQADINQCPPGGNDGIKKIAQLMGIPIKPLNTAFGNTKPKAIALIDENKCIGCTFCLRACPVDAIVGAAKQMHTVIAAECTGCELCIAPCPMDCIEMIPLKNTGNVYDSIQVANKARMRHQSKLQRLLHANYSDDKTNNSSRHAEKYQDKKTVISQPDQRKKAIIQVAMQRAAAIRNYSQKYQK
ncbi:MAG: electron transport complex subunit RsxB [Nitrosomonas sp.]|nr:electron transport complex subunit RsxB [Nitrosomonas sp.]